MSQVSKDSGVNLDAGNELSKHGARMSRETFRTAPSVRTYDFSAGHFRGPIAFDFDLPPGAKLFGGADGVGTKVKFAITARRPHISGYDVLGMCSGDITRRGGRPLAFWNVLDTATLGDVGSEAFEFFTKLLEGLRDAALSQGIALMGGETAELGPFVGSDDPDTAIRFNWAGFMLGALHPDYIITGEQMMPGHYVFALRDVFRSNGISAVRKALRFRFGETYWKNPKAETAIKSVATPTALYDKMFVEANGWDSGFKHRIPISGIVHITGGGIPEKFGDILFPTGYSADLYDLWNPPDIMMQCAGWLRDERKSKGDPGITDRELYKIWGGGQGALVVVPPEHAGRLQTLAHNYNVEMKECGRIVPTKTRPTITLTSKFSGEVCQYS